MMDIRYYILDELYADGYHCGYVDLLNAMEKKHSMPGTVTRALLNEMAEERLVSGAFKAYGGIRLEDAGVALYSRLVEEAKCQAEEQEHRKAEQEAAKAAHDIERVEQRAYERSQKIKDRIFDILKVLLGAALTLLVQLILKIID
jgi:hypothetical protein